MEFVMGNSLVCIRGVRGYEKDGVAYLHIEDVARGLGFTTKVKACVLLTSKSKTSKEEEK